MKISTRKYGSSRRSKAKTVELLPNYSGQGGFDFITFWDPLEQRYVFLEPESKAEVHALMSQAHIVHHNWNEPTSKDGA